MGELEALYHSFGERAAFFVVYIREAHPTDGWQVESNLRDGVEFAQPRSLEERAAIAETCVARLGLSAPLLLDGIENAASHAYNAWPERLYVIARGSRIAYQGGKGPYGFDPVELGNFLRSGAVSL